VKIINFDHVLNDAGVDAENLSIIHGTSWNLIKYSSSLLTSME